MLEWGTTNYPPNASFVPANLSCLCLITSLDEGVNLNRSNRGITKVNRKKGCTIKCPSKKDLHSSSRVYAHPIHAKKRSYSSVRHWKHGEVSHQHLFQLF